MHKLVMNFLVTEGYPETAEKFRLESGTEKIAEIDSATITRETVKKAVLNGNMDDAIQEVKDLYPEILVANPQLYFHLLQQQFIELIRNGKVEEASEFVRTELAPEAEKDQGLLEEFKATVSLLAFEDVTKCPDSKLLDMSQLLKTAGEVNAAILLTQIPEGDTAQSTAFKILMSMQKELNQMASDCRADYSPIVAFLIAEYLESRER